MGILSSLKREHKIAVGILQLGNFLEYFDLMLYMHMAVLLNELFFPKTDPHTASIIAAFAFCSTFVLRPFGALIFGYVGDHIGRKTVVVFTTMMMAFSCLVMAILPTYAQIGIAASWFVTFCRMLQGMSSMGEAIGSKIYITEITKPPLQYPLVALIGVFSTIGTTTALAVSSLVTVGGLNWRLAFWFGALIAIIGAIVRTRLQDPPKFLEMKKRVKDATANAFRDTQEKRVCKKTVLAYFLIHSSWPVFFYFTYIYCGGILKKTFGFSPAQVIHHNLIVAIIQFVCSTSFVLLSYKIYPLRILKAKLWVFTPVMLLCPWLLLHMNNPLMFLFFQAFVLSFAPESPPATAIFYTHFPILKRFTYTSFIFAFSHALMYIVTSFGIVYLTDFLNYWGLLVIMLPVTICFTWGVSHFEELEKQALQKPALSDTFIYHSLSLTDSRRKRAV